MRRESGVRREGPKAVRILKAGATVSPPSDWPAAATWRGFSRPEKKSPGAAFNVSGLPSTQDTSAGRFTRSGSYAAGPAWQLVSGKFTDATR
jgi:hypothetical protein